MDKSQVIQSAGPVQSVGTELLAQARRAEIIDADSAARMTDLLGIVKAQLKKAEDARKALVKPLNDHVKWINNQFKDAGQALVEADKEGRDKLSVWQRAERRRLEDEALAKALELEKAGDAEMAEVALEPQKTVTRGNMGATASTRSYWSVQVVDLSKVPQRFLIRAQGPFRLNSRAAPVSLVSLNLQAIAEARAAGEAVNGLTFHEEIETVLR